jgi:hypothetical protein
VYSEEWAFERAAARYTLILNENKNTNDNDCHLHLQCKRGRKQAKGDVTQDAKRRS